MTAAAPDMSVFIVSMPPAVLIDRPPESNTTPLPTSASVAFAPRGSYASRRKRGGRSEPAPTPRTPPSRSRVSCSPLHTRTVSPLARARARAFLTTVSGDLASAGSLTRSRAHATASAIARAALQAGAHLGVRAPEHLHASQPRGLGVRLVREELVGAERHAFRERLGRFSSVERRRRRVEQRRGHLLDLRRAAGERRPGPAQGVVVDRVRVAHPDEHRGLRAELSGGRHRERFSALALEAGLGSERQRAWCPARGRRRRRRDRAARPTPCRPCGAAPCRWTTVPRTRERRGGRRAPCRPRWRRDRSWEACFSALGAARRAARATLTPTPRTSAGDIVRVVRSGRESTDAALPGRPRAAA